ncbi:MAG: hypothetical protein GDA51_03285 [Ekhidna sp.]|nr:hypothetical protein [Ekhidna sp.]
MFRQSREDCCNAIVVILNLQGFQNLEGFSNIIINKGSFFHQNTSLWPSGEPVARYPVLKKQKGNPKERKCNRKQ